MHIRTRRHTIAAVLASAGLVAGSGVAVAQPNITSFPGTDASPTQIAVGYDELATVEVEDVDEDSTEVTGTFTNNSEGTLSCDAPGGDGLSPTVAGTVTHADLVDRYQAYITDNLVAGGGGLDIPGLDLGSMNDMLASGSLGSLGMGDQAAYELSQIQDAQRDAKLAGHYGTVDPFTVDAGEDFEWTATLPRPTADRTDFDAAALFTCEDEDGQWYAFAGQEEDDDSNGGNGSLDLGSLDVGGSLGS